MKRFHCGCLVLLIALWLPRFRQLPTKMQNRSTPKDRRPRPGNITKRPTSISNRPTTCIRRIPSTALSFERTKFLAAAAHVHRGQLLRDAGKLSEALKEFQTGGDDRFLKRNCAAGDQAHAEADRQGAAAGAAAPTSRAPQEELSESAANIAGPVQLAPISQTPLTLKLDEDSKKVYEAIGNLAGINVLFDPDYMPRRIHVELNAVSLEQALRWWRWNRTRSGVR